MLLNLATPPAINQEFIKRLTNLNNIQQQKQAGDDKTKIAKKIGELHYKGDIFTPTKAINVSRKLFGLLTMMYANVETNLPLIWTMIQYFVDAMRDTQSGRPWMLQVEKTELVETSIVLEFQTLVANMMKFSKVMNLLEKLGKKSPIPHSITIKIISILDNTNQRLCSAINDSNHFHYKTKPGI